MDMETAISRGNEISRLKQDCERCLRNILTPYYLSGKFWEWYASKDVNVLSFEYFSTQRIFEDYNILRNELKEKFNELFEYAPETSTIRFLKDLISIVESEWDTRKINYNNYCFSTDYFKISAELSQALSIQEDISVDKLKIFIIGRIDSIILECTHSLNEILKSFLLDLNKEYLSLKKEKVNVFSSFDDLFVDENCKLNFYEFLKEHRLSGKQIFEPNSDFKIRKTKSKHLYGIIKDFNKKNYFKGVKMKELHSLTNTRFKTNTSWTNFNNSTVFC